MNSGGLVSKCRVACWSHVGRGTLAPPCGARGAHEEDDAEGWQELGRSSSCRALLWAALGVRTPRLAINFGDSFSRSISGAPPPRSPGRGSVGHLCRQRRLSLGQDRCHWHRCLRGGELESPSCLEHNSGGGRGPLRDACVCRSMCAMVAFVMLCLCFICTDAAAVLRDMVVRWHHLLWLGCGSTSLEAAGLPLGGVRLRAHRPRSLRNRHPGHVLSSPEDQGVRTFAYPHEGGHGVKLQRYERST